MAVKPAALRINCARLETTRTHQAVKPLPNPTLPHALSLMRFGIAFLGLALSPSAVLASPQLQCTFEVNSETHHTVHATATDPYTVAAVPIGNRFRFKAIVLAAAQEMASSAAPNAPSVVAAATPVESVNIYVYYTTRRQPMVMQHLQYVQPLAQRNPAPDALTGRVALYSPLLGKELQYQCALAEVAP